MSTVPLDRRPAPPALVHTESGTRERSIRGMQLSAFERPAIAGNRGRLWRASWYLTSALLFQSTLLGLLPSPLKALILRAFGARVGRGLVCKPRVTIKYPWFLELGEHVWLGEGAWIDNHCPVRIGSDVCISQAAYLFTGNHDWNHPRFRFFCRPIEIGDGCWIGAMARIGPGLRLPAGTVVGAGVRCS